MEQKIKNQRCIIIAAAPFDEDELTFIKNEINDRDFIMCADGGFEKALKANVVPDLVIGDLDSNKIEIPSCVKTIKLPVKKDDTDTMTCVKKAIALNFKEVIILGAIKGRMDHAMANISALLYAEKHGLNACLKDDKTEIYLALSHKTDRSKILFTNKKGYTVSIMPFGAFSIRLHLKGLEYPLDNQILYIDNPIGVSNFIVDNDASISLLDGTAIIFLIKGE